MIAIRDQLPEIQESIVGGTSQRTDRPECRAFSNLFTVWFECRQQNESRGDIGSVLIACAIGASWPRGDNAFPRCC